MENGAGREWKERRTKSGGEGPAGGRAQPKSNAGSGSKERLTKQSKRGRSGGGDGGGGRGNGVGRVLSDADVKFETGGWVVVVSSPPLTNTPTCASSTGSPTGSPHQSG